MKDFSVIEQVDSRVVLVPVRVLQPGEALLQTIRAESWVEARSKVKETQLYHNFGHGWFRR